jgi:iron complex transport system substrate-binding protein
MSRYGTAKPLLRPHARVSRRRLLSGILGAGLIAGGWACTRNDDGAETSAVERSPRSAGAGTPPVSPTAGERFPRTITHSMGQTTIPAIPQRIAVMSDYEELDPVLVLGIRPVLWGYTNYSGSGMMPWITAGSAADTARYDIKQDSFEYDLERISAARPDLIVGVVYGLQQSYGQLAGIAPTVALPAVSTVDWRESQRLVGAATGQDDAAGRVIAETEANVAEARATLGAFAGRRVLMAFQWGDRFYVSGAQTAPARLVRELGLVFEDKGTEATAPGVSLEQIRILAESDIIFGLDWNPAQADALERNTLFRGLPPVQEGRYLRLSPQLTRAVNRATALSIPWLLPRFTDALVRAAEGRGHRPA